MPLENELRVLMTLGFGLLLVLLRLEALRFGSAEYSEAQHDGRPASFLRRISWLLIGLLLTVAIWLVVPDPQDVFLVFGERSRAIVGGIAYAAIGSVVISAVVLLRLRSILLPPMSAYPLGITNAVGTAFIDEVTFRAVFLGLLLATGLDPLLAIVIQALLYGLATRTGAPGHDLMLLTVAIGFGLMSGWLTVETGGIGAAFFGHAVSRVALFLLTGGLNDTRPVDQIAPVHEPGPPGWDTVDHGGSRRAPR